MCFGYTGIIVAILGFRPGRVEVRGLDEFLSVMERLRLNVRKAGREVLLLAGTHLEGKLKRKLSRPATGKKYRVFRGRDGVRRLIPDRRTGKKGRYSVHRASAPGLPPAVDMGRLRASVTHNVTGRPGSKLPDPGGGRDEVRAHVGTNVAYGYYLERGARIPHAFGRGPPVIIQARPWFYITVQLQMLRIMQIIENGLRDFIRREAGRG